MKRRWITALLLIVLGLGIWGCNNNEQYDVIVVGGDAGRNFGSSNSCPQWDENIIGRG